MAEETYTREGIITKIGQLKSAGFVKNSRPKNQGGVGNTVEDYLGIKENNLSIADMGEYELKTKRKGDKSLTTLFHLDPFPRERGSLNILYDVLLPVFGWPNRNNAAETSLRLTVGAKGFMGRGFTIVVDNDEQCVRLLFDPSKAAPAFAEWRDKIVGAGKDKLDPYPHWPYAILKEHVDKITNVFMVFAESKGSYKDGTEEFHYVDGYVMEGLRFDVFLEAIRQGTIVVDFDCRTGVGRKPHNHGTKFRFLKLKDLIDLYPRHEKFM